jgi:hypothetical protein
MQKSGTVSCRFWSAAVAPLGSCHRCCQQRPRGCANRSSVPNEKSRGSTSMQRRFASSPPRSKFGFRPPPPGAHMNRVMMVLMGAFFCRTPLRGRAGTTITRQLTKGHSLPSVSIVSEARVEDRIGQRRNDRWATSAGCRSSGHGQRALKRTAKPVPSSTSSCDASR